MVFNKDVNPVKLFIEIRIVGYVIFLTCGLSLFLSTLTSYPYLIKNASPFNFLTPYLWTIGLDFNYNYGLNSPFFSLVAVDLAINSVFSISFLKSRRKKADQNVLNFLIRIKRDFLNYYLLFIARIIIYYFLSNLLFEWWIFNTGIDHYYFEFLFLIPASLIILSISLYYFFDCIGFLKLRINTKNELRKT